MQYPLRIRIEKGNCMHGNCRQRLVARKHFLCPVSFVGRRLVDSRLGEDYLCCEKAPYNRELLRSIEGHS